MRAISLILVFLAFFNGGANLVGAQTKVALVFSVDSPLLLTSNKGQGAFAELDVQEIALAKPGPLTAWTAEKVLSLATIQAFQGDPEGLGDYTAPFVLGGVDAILIPPGERYSPAMARLPFISVTRRTMPVFYQGKPLNLDHATIFRWLPGGDTQVFINRSQLWKATGLTGNSLDLDAACLDGKGNFYFSLALDEPAANPVYRAGDLCLIPGTGITWNKDGTIADVQALSALVIARQTDLDAMVKAAGIASSTGVKINLLGNLSGLEIDPGGGDFNPPATTLINRLPNLLFTGSGPAWGLGICSTAKGGSIALVEGAAMGSLTRTTGSHLGVEARTSGPVTCGLAALAFTGLPLPQVDLGEDQGGRFTKPTAKLVFRWRGGEPFRNAFLLLSPGPGTPGRFHPSYLLDQALLTGNREVFLFGSFVLPLALGVSDARGCGSLTLPLPAAFAGPYVMTGQAFSLVQGSRPSLSLPILLQWW